MFRPIGGVGTRQRRGIEAAPVIGDGTGFGNSGMGIVQGPGQFNFDFSVAKNTRLFEKQSLQFRAEFFNIFNNVNFALPGNNMTVPGTVGRITSTSTGPRVIQFALKYLF